MTENETHKSRFTIADAARWTGKNKRTIQRHIKNGKLTVKEDSQGRKYIDATDLVRTYPEDFKKPTEGDKERQDERKSPHVTDDSMKLFQERCIMLENQVKELKQDKEDFKQEREIAREREKELFIIAKGLQEELKEQRILLLPSSENQKKQGFWARAFGR